MVFFFGIGICFVISQMSFFHVVAYKQGASGSILNQVVSACGE